MNIQYQCPECGQHWLRRETYSNMARREDKFWCANGHMWWLDRFTTAHTGQEHKPHLPEPPGDDEMEGIAT